MTTTKFGQKIRDLREEKKMLLRELAPKLNMDIAMLSKIERGERLAKKETVIKAATILKVKSEELLTLWLADRVYDVVKGENFAMNAIILAEKQVLEKR